MLRRIAAVAALALSLSACSLYDEWFGEAEAPPLPGERIAILLTDRSISSDAQLAELPVVLPRAEVNAAWPQAGGTPEHAMVHPDAPEQPKLVWRRSIGTGSRSDQRRLLTTPVVSGPRIYAMDSELTVSAFAVETGEPVWSVDVRRREERDGFGGGIAFDNGRIFVANGNAEVLALDAENGEEIWRKPVSGPVRAAPTVAEGRVYIVTVENRLEALDAATGDAQWTHSGTPEIASLLGAASPAATDGAVIAAYTSGEVVALRSENGRTLWSDSLIGLRRTDVVSELASIRGLPVIYRGFAFAVSHGGRSVAVDIRSGNRVWDRDFGGTQTPWIAGEFAYILTNDAELLCVVARDGRVRWVKQLDQYRRPDRRDDRMLYGGPVLAGERLIVTSSRGEARLYSPYDGSELGTIPLPDATLLPPVVASRTVYFLSEDGTLSAYR